MRLGFLVDAKGRVPVKVLSRTFASGNREFLLILAKYIELNKIT